MSLCTTGYIKYTNNKSVELLEKNRTFGYLDLLVFHSFLTFLIFMLSFSCTCIYWGIEKRAMDLIEGASGNVMFSQLLLYMYLESSDNMINVVLLV